LANHVTTTRVWQAASPRCALVYSNAHGEVVLSRIGLVNSSVPMRTEPDYRNVMDQRLMGGPWCNDWVYHGRRGRTIH